MTEIEKLMYHILSKLSEANAPLVFKGALITKLILAESGYTTLERHTRDIDANWIGAPPSMDNIVNTINHALGEMQELFYATAFREYGERMSAGISIREKATNKEVVTMDIDIKPIYGDRIYHYGEISIKGVLAQEILADKITVISKKLIFRRTKDLIDIYALSHCIEVQTSEIFKVFEANPNRDIGDFSEFYTRKEELEHAYNRLAGVDNKPPFEDVYQYLKAFIYPFAQNDRASKSWNSNDLTWG